jgi:hypothetical protein
MPTTGRVFFQRSHQRNCSRTTGNQTDIRYARHPQPHPLPATPENPTRTPRNRSNSTMPTTGRIFCQRSNQRNCSLTTGNQTDIRDARTLHRNSTTTPRNPTIFRRNLPAAANIPPVRNGSPLMTPMTPYLCCTHSAPSNSTLVPSTLQTLQPPNPTRTRPQTPSHPFSPTFPLTPMIP